MLLAIDLGNTQTHIGMFRGEELVESWRLATVRVTKTAPHWLRGDLIGVVRAGRRRRVRIPVEAV